MAQRPVFIPRPGSKAPVQTQSVEFDWYAGLSSVQKKKSIFSLHENIKNTLRIRKILEISSKSLDCVGISLSAFNLLSDAYAPNCVVPVENVFQASKVFERGGPFHDLLYVSARDAKKDIRLKEAGSLKNFSLNGEIWPIDPQTLFYDWVYLKALSSKPILCEAIINYEAFTDIEFNPKKSINCQAYSAALFVSLHHSGILGEVLSDPSAFRVFMCGASINNARQNDTLQASLF